MSHGKSLALLFCAALLLLGYRLGVEPVGRTSEKRCHEVAGTMLATGDWLVPYYEGEPRLQKPPLYYWLAAGAAKVGGGWSLLATRAPSALAALLLLVLVYAWAQAMRGRSFGLLAAAMLWLSFQFATNGRRGDAEMWLTLSSTAALACVERWIATRNPRWLDAFFLACILGFLAKATVVFFTIALPLTVYLFLARRFVTIDRNGLLIRFGGALAIGAIWYVVLLLRVDHAAGHLFGDLLRPAGIEVIDSDGDASHVRAPWYYLDKLPGVSFPVSLLLPVIVWRLWRRRCLLADGPIGLVAVVFVSEFILFSVLPQKQKHYMLPCVPLVALLAADTLEAIAHHRMFRKTLRVAGILFGAAALLMTAVLLSFVIRIEPHRGSALVMLALALAGLVIGARAVMRTDLRGILIGLILTELGLMSVYRGHLEPWKEQLDELTDASAPDPAARDELLALAKEHPKLISLIGARRDIEQLEESLVETAPQPPPEK